MAREKRKKAHPAQADAVSFFEERKEQRRKQRKTIRKRWMFNSLGMVFLIVIGGGRGLYVRNGKLLLFQHAGPNGEHRGHARVRISVRPPPPASFGQRLRCLQRTLNSVIHWKGSFWCLGPNSGVLL